jgi:hypothetical protein
MWAFRLILHPVYANRPKRITPRGMPRPNAIFPLVLKVTASTEGITVCVVVVTIESELEVLPVLPRVLEIVILSVEIAPLFVEVGRVHVAEGVASPNTLRSESLHLTSKAIAVAVVFEV